jgi:plasmid stability protein
MVNMVIHMKTTLNIDDTVMQQLREEAARQGRTMSELVEAGLRRVLDEPTAGAKAPLPKLPRWRSGGARVDVADRDSLYEYMEGR